MSYNAQAESYSLAAETPWPTPGFDHPAGWSSFNQVYSDIADATPINDVGFRVSELIGNLPSIAHLSPRTQGEIIRVVVRDMLSLPMQADGLRRAPGCRFVWRFADRREFA